MAGDGDGLRGLRAEGPRCGRPPAGGAAGECAADVGEADAHARSFGDPARTGGGGGAGQDQGAGQRGGLRKN